MARTIANPGTDRTNRLIFLGAVGLALLAAVLVFAALANFGEGDGVPAIGDTRDIVVAAQDISPGDDITADMVQFASVPDVSLYDQAYTDVAPVAGNRAAERIARGDQITAAKLVGGEEPSLPGIIAPGWGAMAVPASEETIVGGLVAPGDRVDIVVVSEIPAETGSITRGITLLQSIEVLAVAQETVVPIGNDDVQGDPLVASGASPDDFDEDPDAGTVTLLVRLEDAPLLAVAQEEGTIYLVLRGLGDDSIVEGVERFLP